MLQAAIGVGKDVRTKTGIGKGSVSTSSAAVELMAMKAMPDLRKAAADLRVAVLGAGKMARLFVIALFSKFPDIRVTVVNRSVDRARALLDDEVVAGRGGSNASAAPMEDLWRVVGDADVVFAATGAEEPIIRPEDVGGRARSLMLIDISVPLNIAPGCGDVDGVASYTVDDLREVVRRNEAKRQKEVDEAGARPFDPPRTPQCASLRPAR